MKTTLITLSSALICTLAIHLMPAETVAKSEALQPSFDVAMPAPLEPLEQVGNPVKLAAKS